MSVLRNGQFRFRDQVYLSGLYLCLEYIKGLWCRVRGQVYLCRLYLCLEYIKGLWCRVRARPHVAVLAFNLPEAMDIILNLLAYLFVRGNTGG